MLSDSFTEAHTLYVSLFIVMLSDSFTEAHTLYVSLFIVMLSDSFTEAHTLYIYRNTFEEMIRVRDGEIKVHIR